MSFLLDEKFRLKSEEYEELITGGLDGDEEDDDLGGSIL
jgi:hypothetical protein